MEQRLPAKTHWKGRVAWPFRLTSIADVSHRFPGWVGPCSVRMIITRESAQSAFASGERRGFGRWLVADQVLLGKAPVHAC